MIEKACKVFVLQLEIPILTVKHIIAFCKREGIITVVNPAPKYNEFLLTDTIFDCIDYLIPNETESRLITGKLENGTTESLMDTLLDNRKMTVIMTLGSKGAYIGQNHQVE